MCVSAAKFTASGDGSTVFKSMSRRSALEIIFCVTTRTSPDSSGVPCARAASDIRLPNDSPPVISGIPVMPMTSMRGTSFILAFSVRQANMV